MFLRNLLSVEHKEFIDIQISYNKISAISLLPENLKSQENEPDLHFENAIVFPGLINSHDHLDFNCFPKLGNKIYNNYVEWGEDIHANKKTIINKVLKIPQTLRVHWGIYKNLINGITTVVNHGSKLEVKDELINVYQDCNILHSIQMEKNWKLKLNNPFTKKNPVVVHVGEGTDKAVNQEIDQLIKWNFLQKELIGIHGIAMNELQASAFKALVWCPDSNLFFIGKTAEINQLQKHTKILFGTDSTVSASWNLWDHLQVAQNSKMVSDQDLFDMLTKNAAEVWKMKELGFLKTNFEADLVIAKRNSITNPLDAFFSVTPEDILMVLLKGKIKLFDADLYPTLLDQKIDLHNFYKVKLNESFKYVWGNLPGLISEIKQYYPEAEFPVN